MSGATLIRLGGLAAAIAGILRGLNYHHWHCDYPHWYAIWH